MEAQAVAAARMVLLHQKAWSVEVEACLVFLGQIVVAD